VGVGDVMVSSDGRVKIFDTNTGAQLHTLDDTLDNSMLRNSLIPPVLGDPERAVFCMQVPHRINTGVDLAVIDLETGARLHVLPVPGKGVRNLSASRVLELDGRCVLAPTATNVAAWERHDPEVVNQLPLTDLGEVPTLVVAAANHTG
jgi:hypothetical protein